MPKPKLSSVDTSIVVEAVLDELRGMARSVVDDLSYSPYEAGNVEDARWKVERMRAIIDLLEQVGFVEKKRAKCSYAGTEFTEHGERVFPEAVS